MSPLLTTTDVAELLNLAERTIRKHAANGELPALRIGGTWRFDRDDLNEALNEARVNA